MIDQSSVFADRFRNNRQALQAAVLGQNSGVDPYTALRALQLLKESDSMQMAQQGQQPTEAPSLLQEAMQPPQMPMGMAVPGQQMSQAPQQSGGLEAMPVPEQDFAGGGIIAFAGGGSGEIEMLQQKAQEAKRLYEAAAKSGDTRASDLYMRQQLDAEAALAKAMTYETQGMEMPGYDNPTPGKGETWDYLKDKQKAFDLQRQRQIDDLLTAGSPANLDVRAAQEAADAAALQAETAALGNRYPAPAPSIAVGGRWWRWAQNKWLSRP